MIQAAFISPIWANYLKNINLHDLQKFCTSLKQNNKGRTASNLGGWQSQGYEERINELGELLDLIVYNCNEFHINLGFKLSYQHIISNYWINVNGKGHMNHPHTHPGSVMSGVFYIKANPKTSGRIMFVNPQAYHCNEDIIEHFTPATSGSYFQWPEEGKLLIFPSWMTHYVEPNTDDAERISLSFNTVLVKV